MSKFLENLTKFTVLAYILMKMDLFAIKFSKFREIRSSINSKYW